VIRGQIWGQYEAAIGAPTSNELREGDVQIYSRNDTHFNTCSLTPPYPAAAGKGDSGGPLAVDVDGTFKIVGVISASCLHAIVRFAYFGDWVDGELNCHTAANNQRECSSRKFPS
jgi:hypothetical protein